MTRTHPSYLAPVSWFRKCPRQAVVNFTLTSPPFCSLPSAPQEVRLPQEKPLHSPSSRRWKSKVTPRQHCSILSAAPIKQIVEQHQGTWKSKKDKLFSNRILEQYRPALEFLGLRYGTDGHGVIHRLIASQLSWPKARFSLKKRLPKRQWLPTTS